MGLRDIFTGRHQVKGPAPDRLFAISTAYVTLESEHQIMPAGAAAIVFQALATSDFESTLKETEEVVTATGSESGTTVTHEDDSFGYRWMVLHNGQQTESVEDLAVGLNAVSSSIETAGHGDRLLCAVFSFADRRNADKPQPVYFIYNYKRGFWYPFVPDQTAGREQQRLTERELQIKAQIGEELPIEPEVERWFPLWGIPI